MTREAFVREEAGVADDPDGVSVGEEGAGRDFFTPLWKTKGAHSFGGGLLQHVPPGGGVPGSNLVESEGFVPLRKVRPKEGEGWRGGADAGNCAEHRCSSVHVVVVVAAAVAAAADDAAQRGNLERTLYHHSEHEILRNGIRD